MLKPNFNSNSSRQVLLRLGYNNCLYCIVSHNSKKKRKEGKKKKATPSSPMQVQEQYQLYCY